MLKKLQKLAKSANVLLLVSLVLLLIFLRWILSTVLPVLWVEAKYNYRKLLTDFFHVTSLRALIIPDFSGLSFEGQTKYRDYGIVIPAIFIDEPVIFNVDPNNEEQYRQALKKGIAHASSTAFPDNGGIGYYFAHSSSQELVSQYNAVFYLLGKLKKDDVIYIWHEDQKYEYQVTESRITQPGDVSFLNQFYDQETIVLQTCWPAGTTRQRLLVFATRRQ